MQNLFSLEGRTALVTGGSRGIGKMIAAGFVAHGAKVYISSRKVEACEATAKELSAKGGSCIPIAFDISEVGGARSLAAALGSREKKLDILVNNAGAAWLETFEKLPEKGWDKVMDLNVKSPFFLTQALHGLLRAAATLDKPAKVINITSTDGVSVTPQETYSYGASKAALIHLTKRMALKLIGDHIVVSSLAPGAFASEMNVMAREEAERVAAAVPAGRIGHDEDMAGAAIYLASRAGDYVVGQTLVVDGGIAITRVLA